VVAVVAANSGIFSQIASPKAPQKRTERVQLQKNAHNHRLIIAIDKRRRDSNGRVVQLDLTTVQLFDLVEAVDQFFADSQTLPDLSLQLTPVSKALSSNNL